MTFEQAQQILQIYAFKAGEEIPLPFHTPDGVIKVAEMCEEYLQGKRLSKVSQSEIKSVEKYNAV